MSMLGYINAKKAKDMGFTHHASYYGLPVWIGNPFEECPAVMAKWTPADYLLPAICAIEGFIRSTVYPHDEPVFQFRVFGEI